MKITDLSNEHLISEIMRPILAEFYPDLEPFTLDEVKKILEERTGKKIEDVDSWINWYADVYQPAHQNEGNIDFIKGLYDMRKKINAAFIKHGLKPLEDRPPKIYKITELSNQHLIVELMRPIFALVYPEMEPFTQEDVKKILEGRTGKKVEAVDDWIEWYLRSYQPVHEIGADVSGVISHYKLKKKLKVEFIKEEHIVEAFTNTNREKR